MQVLNKISSLISCALIAVFIAAPAYALECQNSGAPGVAPDDTGDGEATACGPSAIAGGTSSTALGILANSPGDYGAAVGYDASADGNASVALGYLATSVSTGGVALGAAAYSTAAGGTALGTSALSVGANSTALGSSASAHGQSTVALGHFSSAQGEYSIAMGYAASSAGGTSAVLGYAASSPGTGGTALGFVASAVGDFSSALGYDTVSPGYSSTALGNEAYSVGNRSTALGFRAYSSQPDTVILGSIAGWNDATAYANVGIGTHTPLEAVDVERSAAAARFQLSSFTATASEAPQFIQRRARGTAAAPTAVQNNDNLGLFSFRGYNGSSMGGSRATITAQAAGAFSASSTPTRLIFSTTPAGKTAPESVLVITPDGKVQVKGVNLNVPDYVFEDDYELMPLDELKTFIDKNGHLPGIPSADEVNAEGHDLAGSDMAHLRKIEELTLYTLQQDTELSELRSEVTSLRAQSERLDAMVSKLMQERDKS